MLFCKVYYILVLLFVVVFLPVFDALKNGDKGVCEVKISTKRTRTKAVTINKWCGRKKCVVKKSETYTVPEKRLVCCNGWGYDADADSCAPVCSTGCLGGHCVAPDVCRCDPPTTLDPDHKNACIQPSCDPPCVNADCLNNTCHCKTDFAPHNSTHCFKCDAGYRIHNFTCAPICDVTCANATCSAPNTCTCLEGYKTKDNFTCEPICDCVNATCIAPHTCSCFNGFVKLNETVCGPKCDSCNGECVGPNICRCREGYKDVNGTCKPVCEACENGHCTAPNECTCEKGFVKNGSDPTKCIKDCAVPVTTTIRFRAKECYWNAADTCTYESLRGHEVALYRLLNRAIKSRRGNMTSVDTSCLS